jgi:hypothetical protein
MNQYFIAEVSFALLNLVKDIQLFLASGSTKHWILLLKVYLQMKLGLNLVDNGG